MALGIHSLLLNQNFVADGAVLALGQAGLGAGSLNSLINDLGVAQGIHGLLCLNHHAADGAVLALSLTGLGAGSLNSLVNDLGVAQFGHIIAKMHLTADGASISGIAVRSAGRFSYHFVIVVAQCALFHIGGVVAAGAGHVGIPTNVGAGGGLFIMVYFVMAQSSHSFLCNDHLVAAVAVLACGLTGGSAGSSNSLINDFLVARCLFNHCAAFGDDAAGRALLAAFITIGGAGDLNSIKLFDLVAGMLGRSLLALDGCRLGRSPSLRKGSGVGGDLDLLAVGLLRHCGSGGGRLRLGAASGAGAGSSAGGLVVGPLVVSLAPLMAQSVHSFLCSQNLLAVGALLALGQAGSGAGGIDSVQNHHILVVVGIGLGFGLVALIHSPRHSKVCGISGVTGNIAGCLHHIGLDRYGLGVGVFQIGITSTAGVGSSAGGHVVVPLVSSSTPLVAQSGNFIVRIEIAAASGAGVFRIADSITSGSNDFGIVGCVTQRCGKLGAAADAGLGSSTGSLCAGLIVAQCCGNHSAAAGAGLGSGAGSCAAGSMTQSRTSRSAADRALLGIRTSSSHPGMTQSYTFRGAANTAGLGGSAGCGCPVVLAVNDPLAVHILKRVGNASRLGITAISILQLGKGHGNLIISRCRLSVLMQRRQCSLMVDRDLTGAGGADIGATSRSDQATGSRHSAVHLDSNILQISIGTGIGSAGCILHRQDGIVRICKGIGAPLIGVEHKGIVAAVQRTGCPLFNDDLCTGQDHNTLGNGDVAAAAYRQSDIAVDG